MKDDYLAYDTRRQKSEEWENIEKKVNRRRKLAMIGGCEQIDGVKYTGLVDEKFF